MFQDRKRRFNQLLYILYVASLVRHSERDRAAALARPGRAAYAVHVIFRVLRKVVVYYELDIFYVDAQIGRAHV